MFKECTENGIIFMQSDKIGAFHAFSTRHGGVSTGDFASMNFGAVRGDLRENVEENYRRFTGLFGVPVDGCCVTSQVHGNLVRTVSSGDAHHPLSDTPYDYDGIVTGDRGLPVFCFTADCVPVLLYDSEGRAAGAIHCGWKSSVKDILYNALTAMEELGAKAGNIHAALGPSIGACCFETDSDVPEAITRYLSGDTDGLWAKRSDGKFLVDLRRANARRLIQLGIQPENIDVSADCTVCSHDRYWSARYCIKHNVPRGSMAAGIML